MRLELTIRIYNDSTYTTETNTELGVTLLDTTRVDHKVAAASALLPLLLSEFERQLRRKYDAPEPTPEPASAPVIPAPQPSDVF